MIGMGFGAFLTLFIISFIAAIVIHSAIHYRFLGGVDGFFAKWIFGWLGAWVATPVIGHWFTGAAIGGQYIIPAFLGAFSTAFMITAVCKMMARTRTAFAESSERVSAPGVATSEVAHGTRAA